MNKKNNKVVLIVFAFDKSLSLDVQDTLITKDRIKEVLSKIGFKVETLGIKLEDFDPHLLKARIKMINPSYIFNLFEGFNSLPEKESEFVKILEEIKIPFTGNSSSVLDLCLDKKRVKELLIQGGLPTPPFYFITRKEQLKDIKLNFPIFIKPCFADASIGIDEYSLVKKEEELIRWGEEKLKKFSHGIIVEEFMEGKEYNVGFLGDYPYECLGVSVLDYTPYPKYTPYLSYTMKWDSSKEGFFELTPVLCADTPIVLKEKIISLGEKAGKLLGCRGYFRVDMREDKEGNIFILEINPNPAINIDSGFIRQAFSKGYKYSDIIERILLCAHV